MLSSSNKKHRIILDFNLITNSIDIEPYKQIKCLKEKASRLYHPIKDIIITHNNKDLTPHENVTIGEYFKNKNNIVLKVQERASVKKSTSIPIRQEVDGIECSCNKSFIKNYCRTCNEFICDYCKLDVIFVNQGKSSYASNYTNRYKQY